MTQYFWVDKFDDPTSSYETLGYDPVGLRVVEHSGAVRYHASILVLRSELPGHVVVVNGNISRFESSRGYQLPTPSGVRSALPFEIRVTTLKCECGSDSVGHGTHASYCPKWSKNQ